VGVSRVVVHIDRLVLRGFRHEDQHGIAAGVQHELSRLFSDRETVSDLRRIGDVPRLRVGGVNVPQGSAPQRVGESVARAIGGEISK
jgi:hypothetical protein